MEGLEHELTSLLSREIAHFEPFFDRWGLLLVFVLVMIEGFGVPAPGLTVLVVGGVLAARGQIELLPLLAAAWLGCVAGNIIGYAIGHYGGPPVLRRLPIERQRLARVRALVRRHSLSLLVVARFVEGLKQTMGIIAGAFRMPPARFAVGTVVSATVWTAVFGLGGWYLEHRFDAILRFFHHFGPWGWGLSALLAVGLVLVMRRHIAGRR